MEKLTTAKRAAVLRCLIEGNSILSTSRITGVAKNTIIRLLADVGDACSSYMHEKLVNMPCQVLQMDESWAQSTSIRVTSGRGRLFALTRR